ncbi:MAG: Minf_1886 family protein [Planctomycetaceae bacterium]
MTVSSSLTAPRLRYHTDAYDFVFDALRFTQKKTLRHPPPDRETDGDAEESHVTGQELVGGIREFALDQFGLLARTVFASWGITSTEDFGRIVFELVEEGRMRKTERDQLSDFYEVFDFEEALDQAYCPRTDFATPA